MSRRTQTNLGGLGVLDEFLDEVAALVLRSVQAKATESDFSPKVYLASNGQIKIMSSMPYLARSRGRGHSYYIKITPYPRPKIGQNLYSTPNQNLYLIPD